MVTKFVSPNVWPIYDNWFMLHKGGSRLVALQNGPGFRCKSSTSGLHFRELTVNSKNMRPGHREIAKQAARKKQRLFLLTGIRVTKGAQFRAYDKESQKAKLTVKVADFIKVPLVFHIVRHIPKDTTRLSEHSKKWTTTSDLMEVLNAANRIFRRAAIRLEMASKTFADVPDLGDWVDTRKKDTTGMVKLRTHSKKSVVNVFVVGKVLNNRSTSGTTLDRDIIVDTRDSSKSEFSRLIAHELGHAFGYSSHKATSIKTGETQTMRGSGSKANITYEKDIMINTRYLMAGDLMESEGFDAGLAKTDIEVMRTGARKIK